MSCSRTSSLPEQRAVGQHGNRDIRHGSYTPDQLAELRVQGGLTGPAQGNVVRPGCQLAFQLFNDLVQGKPLLSVHGQVGGTAELAVDAVIGAGLERNQVDPKGTSEPPGRDRPEDMSQRFFAAEGWVMHHHPARFLLRGETVPGSAQGLRAFLRALARGCPAAECATRSGVQYPRSRPDGVCLPTA